MCLEIREVWICKHERGIEPIVQCEEAKSNNAENCGFIGEIL